MDSIDFESEISEDPVPYDARTVEGFAERLVTGGGWRKGDVLDLQGGLRWRPNLISLDGTKIAHLHFADEMRSYVIDRIRAAYATGLVVHVVLPLVALYDADVLTVLAESDAMVHVADIDLDKAEHHLDAISKAHVPLGPESRKRVALATWQRMREGSNNSKGKRFERFLAFLLDQTLGLQVVERNYRGDTDEIDLVVQIVRYTGAAGSKREFLLFSWRPRTAPSLRSNIWSAI